MAATSFWARLVWADRVLNLNAEPWILMPNFSPPGVGRVVEYSENIRQLTGGADRIGESYTDRAWSFDVRVAGSNEEEVNGYINKLATFLEQSRNSNSKLYLEYYPHNAIGNVPLWGQGVYRYHIKDSYCFIASPWMQRDAFAIVTANVTIAPQAEGSRQRLANAKGMVVYGMQIDELQGISVGYGGTNLVINPVFSNPTDWFTGWGTTSLNVSKNTDPKYILFGDTSIRIDDKVAAIARLTTAVSLGTANSYCVSAYVRKTDDTLPGTADFSFIGGVSVLSGLYSIDQGGGWYRMYSYYPTPAGTAGTVGINIPDYGNSFYMQGFQCELTDANLLDTPDVLVFGDQPGAVWGAGGRGSATSEGDPGGLSLTVAGDTINYVSGCIRVAVKWNCDHSDSGTQTLFYAGTAFRGYFAPATDKFTFYTAGTVATSGSQSFHAGSVCVYHFVWGLQDHNTYSIIYVNGTPSGSVATSAPNVMTSPMFIGNNSSYANPLKANILDFTIWDIKPSAAQILADYNQLAQLVRGDNQMGRQRNPIPYISTKGGAGTVHSHYDAAHEDFAIIANIPGDLPARTIFDVSLNLSGTADCGLLMSNHTYVHYLTKGDEYSGVSSAGSVGTAWVSFPGTAIEILRDWSAYRGQKIYLSTMLTDAGTVDAVGRMRIFYASGVNSYVSESTTLDTTAAGTQWYLIGPMFIPKSMPSEYDWMNTVKELNYGFQLCRTTGGGTITMQQYRMHVGDTIYVALTGMNGVTTQSMIIDGNNVYTYHTGKEDGVRVLYGDIIEVEPRRYNHLIVFPFKIGRTAIPLDTVTFNRVYVVPRYSLL